MTARRFILVLGLVLVPAAARADKHPLSVDFAPSYESGSSLWGYQVGTDVPWPKHPALSGLVQFSHHAGLHEDTTHLSRNVLTLGARYTFPVFLGENALKAAGAGERRGFCPFVHAMVVRATEKGVGTSVTDTAFGVGTGFDFLFSKHGDAGLRAQVDWIRPGENEFVRASVGLVYRFEFH
jgi:hypothetical protein